MRARDRAHAGVPGGGRRSPRCSSSSSDSPASAGGCDNSWLNPGSGDWFNDGNWSAGHSPTETESVCIEVDGDYTVSLVGSDTVASLSIGSTTTTGTQRLAIGVSSHGGSLTAPGGVINGGRGEISLDSNRHSSSVATAQLDPRQQRRDHDVDGAGPRGGRLRQPPQRGDRGDPKSTARWASTALEARPTRCSTEVRSRSPTERRSSTAARARSPTTRAGTSPRPGPARWPAAASSTTPSTRPARPSARPRCGSTAEPSTTRATARSHIEAEGQFNLTGTLHAGQSLKITDAQANAFVGVHERRRGRPADSLAGLHQQPEHRPMRPLLNRGTITLTGAGTPGTDTALFGPVTNAPGGLVRAEYNLGLYTGGAVADTFLNQGRLEAADGVTVIVRRSTTFTNAAGGHIERRGHRSPSSAAPSSTTPSTRPARPSGSKPVVVRGRDPQLHRRRHQRHRGDRPVQPRRDPARRPGR